MARVDPGAHQEAGWRMRCCSASSKGGGPRPGRAGEGRGGLRKADQEKIGFEYVDGPVTPKPGEIAWHSQTHRCRAKPKPNGPGGGSKASRGPLVKVMSR